MTLDRQGKGTRVTGHWISPSVVGLMFEDPTLMPRDQISADMLLEYEQDNDLIYSRSGPRHLGAVLYRFVLATATTLFLDTRRWAGSFCVLCGLACVKAVLALRSVTSLCPSLS